MGTLSLSLFIGIIALTLLITYFSSKKTKNASDFYTAGGGLTATQNGLAVAGDFMSAASFLGITGAISLIGFDGFYMSIGNLLGFLFLLYIVAEPMRNLGKYTLGDMITARFKSNKVRGTAAVNTLVISIFDTIAQLVGGGGLISLMLGIDYSASCCHCRNSNDNICYFRWYDRYKLGSIYKSSSFAWRLIHVKHF